MIKLKVSYYIMNEKDEEIFTTKVSHCPISVGEVMSICDDGFHKRGTYFDLLPIELHNYISQFIRYNYNIVLRNYLEDRTNEIKEDGRIRRRYRRNNCETRDTMLDPSSSFHQLPNLSTRRRSGLERSRIAR